MHDTDSAPQTPAARRSSGKTGAIIGASIAALVAVGFIAAGVLSLWGNSQEDKHGYLASGKDRYAASTYALATDNLDVDLDAAGWIVNRDEFGKVRLEVESHDAKPVFVGIARTSDVSDYLRGTAYTSVSDIDYSPFRASYSDHDGGGRPAMPADQSFWVASTHGSGTQTLSWDIDEGNWSVVVMNADASRGVDADVNAGIKIPFGTLAGISFGGALILLIGAGTLLYLGLRAPRPPKAQNVTVQPSRRASSAV
jgi:hypothetical protein